MLANWKHLSVRVPWHDTGWDGRICKEPKLNGSCIILKKIREEKDDENESKKAGISIDKLDANNLPCCIEERMSFMAPFSFDMIIKPPYENSTIHSHYLKTPLHLPPFSFSAIPYSWLLKSNFEMIRDNYKLDIDESREPTTGFLENTDWVQQHENQKLLLDCFSDHLKLEESLCFFYAKKVPFVEDDAGRRIIIGVGIVKHIASCVEYEYNHQIDLKDKLRSMLWQRVIQHSIRPSFEDGFILPYHEGIELSQRNPDFDPETIVAFSPKDRHLEFSYASELVSHDAAINSLLACSKSLQKVKGLIKGPWDKCITWIDTRLDRLWKARGPCPGIGAVLSAFGLDLGTFIAREISENIGENNDPWPYVDKMFSNPKAYLSSDLAHTIDNTIQTKWNQLPDERKSLLKLLSRFEINKEQAKFIYIKEERKRAGIDATDKDIIDNPYILFEKTRLLEENQIISFSTIDKGVFPDQTIRKYNPLPEPSELKNGIDARRVRALSVDVLEEEANNGSTIMSRDSLVLRIRDKNIKPECKVDEDLFNSINNELKSAISLKQLANGESAYQLSRLEEMGNIIRNRISIRTEGAKLLVDDKWDKLLTEKLGSLEDETNDEEEILARNEKIDALKVLCESRFSVLIGPAGTGKTTLLSILCSHPQIKEGGILLLAPTGKARVKLEQSIGLPGYTIAQFLSPNRYESKTGRYKLSEKSPYTGTKTVIIDEASMLTEEMLASLIQGLKGVERLILVGDPRQLPPIGPGRPFVDIIEKLKPENISEMFPKVGPNYAELTINRRQKGEERDDIQLAQWFSGTPLAPGEDEVFDKVVCLGKSQNIKFIHWDSTNELNDKLLNVLVNELKLTSIYDIEKFDESLGGNVSNGYTYFNLGSSKFIENWQIISPVRSNTHGVPEINRLIHKTFRQQNLDLARKKWSKTPKPVGPEQIVYGDKVINLINSSNHRVYPEKTKYIANGEIGIVMGYFWREGKPDLRFKREIEFSSQQGYSYAFYEKDFGEESSPSVELAYAITVHKSQGSQFKTVILVLPEPCRLLSRELLYTALTRQEDRLVILHKGDRLSLKKYTSDEYSETARRLTNLFRDPSPKLFENITKDTFYEENLIHMTSKGEMVRSKSEVIIANELAHYGIDYSYEQPLKIGNDTKYPDFTIQDVESGLNYYWEHCGMLNIPAYKKNWDTKLEWYRKNKIIPHEEGIGENGTLIVSKESPEGGISSKDIDYLINIIACHQNV